MLGCKRNYAKLASVIFTSALMVIGFSNSSEAEEHLLQDPTRPYMIKGISKSPGGVFLKLKAITISENIRQAVINGYSLSEGDWIEGYQIREIKNWKVILRKKGRERVLVLNKPLDNFSLKEVDRGKEKEGSSDGNASTE